MDDVMNLRRRVKARTKRTARAEKGRMGNEEKD